MQFDWLSRNRFLFFPLFFLVNLALSWAIHLGHSPINTDGVLYIETAKSFLSGGFHAAMQSYQWPFYSVLLAISSQLLHLPLLSTAYLVDAVLIGLAGIAFLHVCFLLKPDPRILGFAAITFLCFRYVNTNRDAVLRDFGYWAFYLFSIGFFIQFFRKSTWVNAILWLCSALAATLFRIEGALFLVGAPFILFFRSGSSFYSNSRDIIKLCWIPVLTGLGVCCYLFYKHDMQALHFGRLPELGGGLIQHFRENARYFHHAMHLIRRDILSPVSYGNESIILTWGLFGIIVNKLVQTLGWFYALLLVYGACARAFDFSSNDKRILFYFMLINLLALAGFVFGNFFLTGRYLMGLCWVLVLGVPFILNHVFHQKPRLFRWMLFAFLLLAVSAFVRLGPSKSYIIDAGEWIKNNVPESSRVYIDNREVAFYAERLNVDWRTPVSPYFILEDGNWKQYDFVAIQVNRHGDEEAQKIATTFHQEPIKIFSNRHGDKVYLFSLEKDAEQ